MSHLDRIFKDDTFDEFRKHIGQDKIDIMLDMANDFSQHVLGQSTMFALTDPKQLTCFHEWHLPGNSRSPNSKSHKKNGYVLRSNSMNEIQPYGNMTRGMRIVNTISISLTAPNNNVYSISTLGSISISYSGLCTRSGRNIIIKNRCLSSSALHDAKWILTVPETHNFREYDISELVDANPNLAELDDSFALQLRVLGYI